MFVVGTAGHVDHGKSSLVRSITGIDPDRFLEEKKRGLTIDLGFAWMELPSGNEVSIIDVPGHESFVSNMLTGVGSIDAAMLIVSADESVMPQTREHLSILGLLEVDKCIVVLTKTDLVDSELVQLVALEIEELLMSTPFSGSKIIPVSAQSGEGLDKLIIELDQLLCASEKHFDLGNPKLSVDRSFSISGFGTVVTGTLLDGKLSIGDEIELNPGEKRARIRGIQNHNRDLDEVMPGNRVALNLSGISQDQVTRGQVLTIPGLLKPTNAIDVQISVLSDVLNPLRHNMTVTFHQGTAVSLAKLRLLEGDEALPGSVVWAQLKTTNFVCVNRGDRFVIRSNMTTLGGGRIIQTHAKRHKRNDFEIISRLENIFNDSSKFLLKDLIDIEGPISFQELNLRSGLNADLIMHDLVDMQKKNEIVNLSNPLNDDSYYYSTTCWVRICKKVKHLLEDFHQDFPLRQGYSKEAIRTTLKIDQTDFALLLKTLEDNNFIVDMGSILRLPSFGPMLTEQQEQEMQKYLDLLNFDQFSPPTNVSVDRELVAYMESIGIVVIVSDKIVFSMDAYQKMLARIRSFVNQNSRISLAEMRDLLGTSRRYVMALADYLDSENITRRTGDFRILR